MKRYILTLIIVGLLSGNVAAGDDEAVREVKEALNALNKAFEKGDAAAIKKLTTADHVAVTPYYGGAMKREEQLRTLPELKLSEYTTGKMSVRLLGREVALVTFPLTMKGTFKGRDVARNSLASAIWVKTDGRWLESFYQETPLKGK